MLTTKALFASGENLDDRSLEFLAQAIERSNLPGFDYFEFKRAVATLASMQIDEATAYKSAFTTAATVGITKEKLLETAAFYKNVVEKEREQFAKALENQQAAKVTSRQTEVTRLRDQIERHKADIQRMQDEMAGYLTQIEQAEASAKTEAEKLTKTKDAFEFTHKSVLLQIEKDIENLHKYV